MNAQDSIKALTDAAELCEELAALNEDHELKASAEACRDAVKLRENLDDAWGLIESAFQQSGLGGWNQPQMPPELEQLRKALGK